MTRDEVEAKSRATDAKRKAERDADIAWNNHARTCDYPASADRALWRAVIAQAMDDATGAQYAEHNDFARDCNFEKPIAREWLTDDSDDFRLVCDFADVGADQVRIRALNFAKMGWTVTRAVRAA
jgi:hypothetical protein